MPCWITVWNATTVFLQRSKTPNECLKYDTRPSDGEAPVLEFGERWVLLHWHYSEVHSNPEYLLRAYVWARKNYSLIYYTWNHLTVCKQLINILNNYWSWIAIIATI